jgi:hypothetical protein
MPDVTSSQHHHTVSASVAGGRWVEAGSLGVAVGLGYFFYHLLSSAYEHMHMFNPMRSSANTKARLGYAWRHRLCGLCLLAWHVHGFIGLGLWHFYEYGSLTKDRYSADEQTTMVAYFPFNLPVVAYDVVLGVLGITTTLTAAFDFEKAHRGAEKRNEKKKKSSGTLDDDAIVSYSEMIEHSFYQGLNLLQIVFLHVVAEVLPSNNGSAAITSIIARFLLALIVTAPWYWRSKFPVNKFQVWVQLNDSCSNLSYSYSAGIAVVRALTPPQDNYNKGQYEWSLVSIMYRTKVMWPIVC